MSLTDLMLPADARGLPAALAGDRAAVMQSRLASLEERACAVVSEEQPEGRASHVSRLVRAWVRSVSSPRAPEKLGRDWLDQLARLRLTNAMSDATVADLLRVLADDGGQDLHDPDRAWLLAHRLSSLAVLSEARQRSAVHHRASEIAVAVGEAMEQTARGLDMDDAPPKASVVAAVERALVEWGTAGRVFGPDGSRVLALDGLISHIVQVLPSPGATWWHFLWANLDREVGERVGRGLHALTNVFDVMARGVNAYPALREWTIFAAAEGMPDAFTALVQVMAVLDCAAGEDLGVLMAVEVDAVAREAVAVDLHAASFRIGEALRRRVERHQVDPLLRSLKRIEALAGIDGEALDLEAQLADGLRGLAHVLAEGMTGAGATERMDSLLRGVLRAAVFARGACDDLRLRRWVFRRQVALDLGAGARPEWRRSREVVAGLSRLLREARGADADGWIDLVSQIDEVVATARAVSVAWGDGVAAKQARSAPGSHVGELADLLRSVGLAKRVLPPQDAAHAAFTAWAITLPDPASVDADHLRGAVSDVLREAQVSLPSVVDVVVALRDGLPSVLAGYRLSACAWRVATAAADGVYDALPTYAERVGERGHQSCVRDNAMTLGALSRILVARRPDPPEALWSWWSAAVDPYLVNRPDGLFLHNLLGMERGLTVQLGGEEAAVVRGVLRSVYSAYLGVRPDDGAAKGPTVTPRPYPVLGPHGNMVFGRPAGANLARRMARGDDLAWFDAASVSAPMRSVIRTYLSALATSGVPDVASHKAMRPVGQALEAMSADDMVAEIDRLLDVLPHPQGAAQQPFWRATLSALAMSIGDVALGRVMVARAQPTASFVAEQLAGRDGSPDEARAGKCVRDQSMFLSAMGRMLGGGGGVGVALEAGRFLVMGVAPFVSYQAPTWRLVFSAIDQALWPHLDRAGRQALLRFTGQLSSLAELLPEVQRLGRDVLHAEEVVFAEDPAEDRRWRELVASLLVVVGSGAHEVYSPSALVQRLVLVDPLLGEETAATWPARGAPLAEFLVANLPERRSARTRGVVDEVLVQLMNVERAAAVASRTLACWCAMESAHPWARSLWRAELIARSVEGGGLRSPEDLFVSQAAGWSLPELRALEVDVASLGEAWAFERDVDPRAAKRGGIMGWFARGPSRPGPEVQASARRWLRAAASDAALGVDGGSLLQLAVALPDDVDASALIGGLADQVAPSNKPLAEEGARRASEFGLARRMLDGPEAMAKVWVHSATPESFGGRDRCVRDLTHLCRHLAAAACGWVADPPAVFYRQQVLPYLTSETRQQVVKLLRAGPASLASVVGDEQSAVLGRWIAPVIDACETPGGAS